MASYLTTTFTTTVSVALPPGTARQDAVRLLHDHALVIELGPLLARYARVEDDDGPGPGPGVDRYTITEKLAYLPWGLWDGELDVRAEFVDTADGVRTTARAPLGFVGMGEWVVKDGEGGGLVLEETVRSTCPVGMRWFVEGTMRRSHETLLARFVERLKEKKESGST
ncbi:hypothetical protein GTA08_BOTSDO09983 [Neofusicoccum parvum]|nr:hypothetical protein GTA08_BOTSDO09983 [Neofusicoccum parvum]